MATIYFTNNLDDSTDSGSLRYAIANAATGDTIMYGGSATGDIEIAISSALPSKSFSLIGSPNQRIILNAQGVSRFYNVSTSLNITFQYVDFKNGARNDAAPIYVSRINLGDSWTFESCRFYGGSGNYAGGIQLASASTAGTVTLNNCVAFDNSSKGTYNSGVLTPAFLYVATASVAVVNITNCTLGKETNRDAVGGLGGTVTKTNCLIDGENNVDFATVGFVDAANYDFRLLPTSSYLTGGATTGVDYLGHARSGSVGAFDGSWLVVNADELCPNASSSVVDYAEFNANAFVTFGEDVFLTVRKGIICDSSVRFYSGKIGYLSAPSQPTATFTGIRFVPYGANVASVSLSLNGVSWTAGDLTVPVLIEKKNGYLWNLLTNEATGGSYTTTIEYGDVIRVFDGVQFLSATIAAPATYNEIAESYALGYVVYDSTTVGYIQ